MKQWPASAAVNGAIPRPAIASTASRLRRLLGLLIVVAAVLAIAWFRRGDAGPIVRVITLDQQPVAALPFIPHQGTSYRVAPAGLTIVDDTR